MAIQEGRAKLSSSMRDLLEIWSATRVSWNDANAEHFEETFLRPLEMDLRGTVGAMDQMASLLIQIRRQCE